VKREGGNPKGAQPRPSVFVCAFFPLDIALAVQKRYYPAMASAPPRIDGRAARAQRTREAVVEAFLDLVQEGVLRPAARQVAERAGVSLRSVFQHFADLESLFAEVAERQMERLRPIRPGPAASGPLEERIAQFVRGRSRMLETITPVRRAALLQEPFSPEIARRLAATRELARREVATVFAPELRARSKEDREELLDALDTATTWAAWEHLRSHRNLPVDRASHTMSRTINSLLKEAGRWSI
jgi:AcrR family transcriptional regulator